MRHFKDPVIPKGRIKGEFHEVRPFYPGKGLNSDTNILPLFVCFFQNILDAVSLYFDGVSDPEGGQNMDLPDRGTFYGKQRQDFHIDAVIFNPCVVDGHNIDRRVFPGNVVCGLERFLPESVGISSVVSCLIDLPGFLG